MSSGERVYVIHENPEWFGPVERAFAEEGVPVTGWLLTGGSIDLSAPPPAGVFWSRLSASAHTRGNEHSKEYGRAVLDWAEAAGRRVINGRSVLDLEVNKAGQAVRLAAAGFDTPRTLAVFGRDPESFDTAAAGFEAPFIVKHNQGGKGLSVQKFDSHDAFAAYVRSDDFEPAVDGVTLVQEYLVAAESFVTRVEFVGGRFLYAVRVDTSAGEFELCPAGPGEGADARGGVGADASGGIGATVPPVVPFGSGVSFPTLAAVAPVPAASVEPFALREGFAAHPLVERYERFLAEQHIDIAGIEFMETADGRLVTYDINTNTNYNPAVEAVAPRSGARESARFAGSLLASSGVSGSSATVTASGKVLA